MAAAPQWKATSPGERSAVLLSAARLLRDRAARIADELVAEEGKTLREASGEVDRAAATLEYHAGRNHFSNWLRARTEFALARRMRPRKVSEFGDLGELRRYLIVNVRDARRTNRRGVVEDFSGRRFDSGSRIARIGGGSMGGLMTSRGSANLLTKATAYLATAFMITSLALAILAGEGRQTTSIITEPVAPTTLEPAIPAAPSVPVAR